MTTARLALALCLVLAVAGCVAPAANAPGASPAADGSDATTTTTATTSTPGDAGGAPEHVVVTGDLSVDANVTFDRVAALLDADYAPTRVVVQDLSSRRAGGFSALPFFSAFGLSGSGASGTGTGVAGLTTLDATVYLSPAAADSARVEQVLAHEFVHVAQVRQNMVPWFGGRAGAVDSLDEQFARRALVEGGAVYVTDAYTRAHQPGLGSQTDQMAAAYANASAANRFVYGQYRFGAQYANATLDGPADLPDLYEDPPETTENVLHPGTRDDPLALNVTVEAESVDRERSQTRRAGELLARVVLRQTTTRSTAREAAAGWGTDRVLAFATPNGSSVAWVTRWDTPADADEFAAAARTLGDRQTDNTYRTERVTEDTVVVFAGSEQFVANAEASGNVTVAA
ncbi:hypothetical protein [Halobacterium jilantaiense]|uniref:Uncharacterized protein n=1 Tax=Halobacterium jilantaiense TaxID=355548 RepID=A0A1I0P554_9EURY|nr:hypothetical protein [Halobacterium jilantaiense]SEW09200.1 hypothetical protein SAMN04487945_1390 [Halobacterium jilantaiense]